MLSAADLAGMQATLTASLPDSCDLVLETLTSDGAGGETVGTPTTTTVACRVSPNVSRTLRNAEISVSERVIADSPWLITLPAGTVVTEQHRIVTGGREFEVQAVFAPLSWELAVRVFCRLLNGGAG